MLGKLTETCPERTLGLMGDVTEMEGPTFWESKEPEPEQNMRNKTDETFVNIFCSLLFTCCVDVVKKCSPSGSAHVSHRSSAGRGRRLWKCP